MDECKGTTSYPVCDLNGQPRIILMFPFLNLMSCVSKCSPVLPMAVLGPGEMSRVPIRPLGSSQAYCKIL